MFRTISGAIALFFGALLSSNAHAGVASTAHNLSGGDTTEICVYCHTPHASNVGLTAPLWNRLTSTAGYITYSSLGTATLDGSDAGGPGARSLTCLSCHDGTQSRDTIINAPGSGLGDTSGWSTGFMSGEPIPVLGTDLRNDHPIGIEYCGGDNGSGGCKDPDFVGGPGGFVECISCHDPHVENPTFLYFSDGNANSQVCFSCHVK